MNTREEYVKKTTELLNDCHDISMLDFVMQLLSKTKAA